MSYWYIRVSAAGTELAAVEKTVELESYNTATDSATNGKNYLVPVSGGNVTKPTPDAYQVLGSPTLDKSVPSIVYPLLDKIVSILQDARAAEVNVSRDAKFLAGITYSGETWACDTTSVGSVATKGQELIESSADTARVITGATQANPVVVSFTGAAFQEDDRVEITGVVGMTSINGNFVANIVAAGQISLSGVDGTGYAAWLSGGEIRIRPEYTSVSGTIKKFDYAGFVTLRKGMVHYSNLVRRKAQVHKNAIRALNTAAGITAYNITLGWPTNVY